MPWVVCIERADGSPLGTLEEVRQRLEAALPQIGFYREPSGLEKMAAVPMIEFPDILRQHLAQQPPEIQADYDGDGFSIRFYLGSGLWVDSMAAEIRGNGNPLPVLAQVCLRNGWIARESGTTEIDRRAEAAAGWEQFRDYRQRVTQDIKNRLDTE